MTIQRFCAPRFLFGALILTGLLGISSAEVRADFYKCPSCGHGWTAPDGETVCPKCGFGGRARAPQRNDAADAQAAARQAAQAAEDARAAAAAKAIEMERLARQAHIQGLNQQTNEAFAKKDYAAALQALEAWRIFDRNAGISNPKVAEAIGRTKTLLAWEKAKTAEEMRAAIAMWPSMFSDETVNSVNRIANYQKWQLEQTAREAATQAALDKMRTKVTAVAESLKGPDQPKGKVIADDGPVRLIEDDKTSREHAAARHGLGFDTFGQLAGGKLPPPPLAPVATAITPLTTAKALLNNPKVQKFADNPAVIKLGEYQAQAESAKRLGEAAQARLETAQAATPNAKEIPMLIFAAKTAQAKTDAAVNMLKVQVEKVEEMVSFEPIGTDAPSPATGKKP